MHRARPLARPMNRSLAVVLALPAVAALVAGCASSLTTAAYSEPVDAAGQSLGSEAQVATTAEPTAGASPAFASGNIVNPAGTQIGTVTFAAGPAGTQVTVQVKGITPGYHGLHVHALGKCEPKSADPKDPAKVGDFNSAGGHLPGTGTDHPEHAGDLPALLVGADGSGMLDATSQRLTQQLLEDADGSALVIHGGADNYANIPSRYASTGPDAETKKAGDAGPRVACAVLQKAAAAGQ